MTNDQDFLVLAKAGEHAGLIFLTSQRAGIGDVVRGVVTLVDTVPEDGFRDRVF